MLVTENECQELVRVLEKRFPRLQFEVERDLDVRGNHYIFVLSDGPDYLPDLKPVVFDSWRWSGWVNLDQRNNMCVIKKAE